MNSTLMDKPLDILFFSPTVPYPAIDGGRIRVFNLVSRLCKTHKVTFLTFITLPTDEQGINYLREMGIEVIGIRLELRNSLRSILFSLFQRKPLTIARYYSMDMVKILRDLQETRNFHVIHFEMLHTGQYLASLKDNPVKTVLGEQNIDSNIWYRLAGTEKNAIKKLIFYSQYRSFAKYESRICGDFDVCTCVSVQDKEKLTSICPEASVEVVPNGVDLDYFKPEQSIAGAYCIRPTEGETSLVFTGSMDWPPNEDAVIYFCGQILPLLRAEIPDIKFHIVGSNPTGRVWQLQENPGVIVTGLVDDVRPYIARSAVYVVPLRIGGGTRLKILQALAMEKAVVSTSIGCEGQELIHGEHTLIADDTGDFASSIIRLIKDKQLNHKLGENGRKFVKERYDWNTIVRGLEKVYRSIGL